VLYVIDTSHTEVKAYWGKVTVSSSFWMFHPRLFIWL
jgi:hypothetical protein